MNYYHMPGHIYQPPQPGDDLIDFPCSESWLGNYYERGLTPRHPIVSPDHVADLERRIRRLEARRAAGSPLGQPLAKLFPQPHKPSPGGQRKANATGIEPFKPEI